MTLRVNGRVIPEKAILAELKRLIDFYSQHLSREELGGRMVELVRKAREHAAGTQLLIDEVKRRHIEVAEEDVDAAVKALEKQAGGEAQLDEVLARQHMTRPQLRATVKAGKQLDKLVTRVTSTVADCTEQEMKSYFEENAERYVTPDQVQARHILIQPASQGDADKAVARSTLLSLRNKIFAGEDFADLAAAHSECASGKNAGGSLGWIARGSSLPEFEKAVFDELDVGDISAVIETPLGFHIVEKLDHEDGEALPFEQVRDRIRDLLMHERKGHALSEFVSRLRQDAIVEDDEGDNPKRWESIFDSFLDGEKGS